MMKKLSLLLLFGLISATFANKIADNRNREKRFLFGVSIKLQWNPVNAATIYRTITSCGRLNEVFKIIKWLSGLKEYGRNNEVVVKTGWS